MSVYTAITQTELEFFFDRYTLGSVIDFVGIEDGIDNTNYFVNTTQGQYVLTLFEHLTHQQLQPYLKLLSRLSKYSIPCPTPQLDKHNNVLRLLNNKPAAIFNSLSGKSISQTTAQHCEQLGLQLAEFHDCTYNYVFPVCINTLHECQTLYTQIEHRLDTADYHLINDELRFQIRHYPSDLPTGIIHSDLFRDNVLFEHNKLTGILDFYSAGKGILLLDIAVTCNDWCHNNGMFNVTKSYALLAAYESLRPLTTQEKQNWSVMLRLAALRFWLSRLVHQCEPRTGEIIQEKDPLFFRHLLEQHRQS